MMPALEPKGPNQIKQIDSLCILVYDFYCEL